MRSERGQGFTLIELMVIVAAVALISSVAIPNLLAARSSSHEASAIDDLRTLCSASELYRGRFGHFPGAASGSGLADLSDPALEPAPFIDAALGSGSKGGYTFTYVGGRATWRANADPRSPRDGVKSFFCDDSGVIRFEADFAASGPAGALSPAAD